MLRPIKMEPTIEQRMELSMQCNAVDQMSEQQAKDLLKQSLALLLARENVIRGLMDQDKPVNLMTALLL